MKNSKDDEFETPTELYLKLCNKYNIFPKLDVAANETNKLCDKFCIDGLRESWSEDVWCNPPHSKTGKFVEKAYNEWGFGNINILMIIPANTVSSKFWHKYIEGIAEYHAQPQGRIRFNKNKKPTAFQARTAYMVVVWRVRR